MKHIIIINPKAGVNNEPAKIKENVEKNFVGLEYEIYFTKGPKDATNFVRNYLSNNNDEVRFYSCGGDGTLNEIANGMIGFDNAQLACYPIGSGNDFIKYFGKVESFLDFQALINGDVVVTDILKFNERYVVNIFNVGLDANVVVFQRKFKKLPLISGKGAYNLGVVASLLRKISHKCKVKVDDEELYNGKMTLCAICNAKCYGGGYYCAPKAVVDDGLVDICMVKKVSRFTFAKLVKDYKAGKHLDNPKFKPYVLYKQGRVVEMEIEKPLYYSIDGETDKSSSIKIEVVPKALRFVVPKIDK